MKTKTLTINQTDVTEEAVIYTCFGIGSCIALFLNDRMTGLAGGAHIPLAHEGTGAFLSVTALLDELMSKFQSKGSDLNVLRAKLAGGAQVFESTMSIGAQNIKAIRQELVERKIFVAAEDVGGRLPRTARFNTRTGDLVVISPDRSRLTI
jgi:chemotaxis protein CheD